MVSGDSLGELRGQAYRAARIDPLGLDAPMTATEYERNRARTEQIDRIDKVERALWVREDVPDVERERLVAQLERERLAIRGETWPYRTRYDALRPGDLIRFSRASYANKAWLVLLSAPAEYGRWVLLVECTLPDPRQRLIGRDLPRFGHVERIEP